MPRRSSDSVDLRVRALGGPVAGLGGEEELVAVPVEERAQPHLGLAVAAGDVDVVDPAVEQQREGAVGLVLRHLRQRGGAEEDAAAVVAGAPEGQRRKHAVIVRGRGRPGRRASSMDRPR